MAVLDTSDAATIRALEAETPLEETLFIVARKSGTTAETLAQANAQERPEVERELLRIRRLVRDAFGVATTHGYGPRFLHSTGQYHKGGPNTGVFLQLTADDSVDRPIPGRSYSFAELERAQAPGDLSALRRHCRRLVRPSGPGTTLGLAGLPRILQASLEGRGR